MIKKLYLSGVSETFDPETSQALGPWCFTGIEKYFPEWENLEFVDPFIENSKLKETENLSRRLSNRLVITWGERLNSRHNTSHSMSYWRFVLISWLLTSVQNFLARYLHVEAFLHSYADEKFQIHLAPKVVPYKVDGFIEFQHSVRRDPRFDYWMTSWIVRYLAPKGWKLCEPESPYKWPERKEAEQVPPFVSNEKSSVLGSLVQKAVGRLSFHSVPGVTWQKIPFSIFLNFLKRRLNGDVYFSLIDDNILDLFPQIFLEGLDAYLKATLPVSYGERYLKLEEKAKQEKTYPGRIFVSNFMPSDEQRRLEFAHAVEAGEKLVTSQHGSGYGIARYLSWASEFEYVYHAFLTWGWKAHNDFRGKFFPVPSPQLSKIKDAHREKKPVLAMVATKIDMSGSRFIGPRPNQWIRYRNLKRNFIINLMPEPRMNLVYFSYQRGATDLEDEEYLTNHVGPLNFARKGLPKEMLGSRILLLDCPSTSLLEGMAANVPTVCYWEPDTWPFCKQAEPYFARLADVGILHHSPEAAASWVNKHWNDVSRWWQTSDVQDARLAWKDQFARTSRFWWFQWIQVLKNL